MQSDTWALATPDLRPWLLMLWTTAWQQQPCGSMPADETLMAARLGMASKAFAKAKSILLRGWWLAEDGRMYHDTIVERVQEMLDYKAKEKQRKADYRARMAGNVPRDNNGTDAGQTQDSGGSDATGTGTGTGTSINNNSNSARENFSMTSGWQPSENFQTIAHLAGAPIPKPEDVGEFVSYWLGNPAMQRTQHEWEHALAKSLKKTSARAATASKKAAPAKTFAERDREAGMLRWEQMTGQIHPDNIPNAPASVELVATTQTLLEAR